MEECKLKIGQKHWLCTENYKCDEEGSYEHISICKTMEDLIQYALTYGYDFDLPKGYRYLVVHNIIFSTGDFDPKDRSCTNIHSNVIYSTFNEKEVEGKFQQLIKGIGKKKTKRFGKNTLCWHTEDYSYNQIIHSYSLSKSYIIERVKI